MDKGLAGSPLGRARWGLLAAYAVVTFLSFPHPVAGRVVDLGLWLAWFGPALLLLGIEGLEPARAARVALLATLAAHSAVLHWIYVVTVSYGHAPPPVGVVAPVALAFYTSSFTCAFGAGWAWLRRRGGGSPLAAALLWTALDYLRSMLLSGFPWATLGYAQHQNPALLGLASATGVYGLSFAVVLAGAALAGLVRTGISGLRSVLPSLAVVAAVHGLGAALVPPEAGSDAKTLRVAALQGNIDQGVKWSPEWVDRTFGVYERLARRAAAQGAHLIVWPETAVPGALELDSMLRERLARLARETRAAHVVGGVGVDLDESGRQIIRYYDSAFLLDARGEITRRYDKTHLVPFGEYVPLRELLGRVLGAVASGIASGDVVAGPEPVALPLAVPGAPAELVDEQGRVKLGVPICYELLFPDLVRRFVGRGAGMLLAITNDAWYGRTGAPYQFLAITAMRSAETGVWIVRAANTGVSAIIDARGRVREQTPIFERGLVVADVPVLYPAEGGTFYVRHGDVFAQACAIGVVLLVAFQHLRSRLGRQA
jgi:apolipoprotein N-acyltransferase